jgi:hypothetical protein
MARRTFLDGSNMPKVEVCRELESWEVRTFVEAIIDEAVAEDDIYHPDTIWLVLDGTGSVVGEVRAGFTALAGMEAILRFPPRPDERRTVIRKTDFQADRN